MKLKVADLDCMARPGDTRKYFGMKEVGASGSFWPYSASTMLTAAAARRGLRRDSSALQSA